MATEGLIAKMGLVVQEVIVVAAESLIAKVGLVVPVVIVVAEEGLIAKVGLVLLEVGHQKHYLEIGTRGKAWTPRSI